MIRVDRSIVRSRRAGAFSEMCVDFLRFAKGGFFLRKKAAISMPFYWYAISFATDLLEELPSAGLPAEWNSEPPTPASQSLGDAWVSAAKSPVLAVPSAIVPEERNHILNLNHSRFPEIQIGAPVECSVDPRRLQLALSFLRTRCGPERQSCAENCLRQDRRRAGLLAAKSCSQACQIAPEWIRPGRRLRLHSAGRNSDG